MSFSNDFLDSIYRDFLFILLTIVLIVGNLICEYFKHRVFQQCKIEILPKEKALALWVTFLPRCFLKKLSFQDQDWYISLRRIQMYQWAVTMPAMLYYIFIFYVASNVAY